MTTNGCRGRLSAHALCIFFAVVVLGDVLGGSLCGRMASEHDWCMRNTLPKATQTTALHVLDA